MNLDTLGKKGAKFIKKNNLKHVILHGLRHSYCSMQMNENDKLSTVDVAKLMGHTELSTTYRYTHSNTNKDVETISVWDDYEKNTISI
jgi:Site-specific recombinase XerD